MYNEAEYNEAEPTKDKTHSRDIDFIHIRLKNGKTYEYRCDTYGRRKEVTCLKDSAGNWREFRRTVTLQRCEPLNPADPETVRETPGPWMPTGNSCTPGPVSIKVVDGDDLSKGQELFCAPSMGTCASAWLVDHKPVMYTDNPWDEMAKECEPPKPPVPPPPPASGH